MKLCFAVERSLGSLAKWLRILGFDTTYEPEAPAGAFYSRIGDDRILVTRSRKIQKEWASHHHIFITSNYFVEQLKQILEHFGIKQDDIQLFSRCIHCNIPIEDVHKKDVFGLVPDYIWETHESFNRCSHCNRIYWAGSHTNRTQELIKQVFESN